MQNRTIKIILASILVFIIVALTGILVFALTHRSFSFSYFWHSGKSEIIEESTYAINEVQNIKVNTRSADVKFVSTDSNEIKVTVYGDKEAKPNVSLENGRVFVDYVYSYFCIGFCFDHSYVEITVPKNYSPKIDVTTVSGDVALPLSGTDLSVKTTSGDIEIDSFKDVNVSSVSGDIKLRSGNNINIDTTSGDITIHNVLSFINAESISGEIRIDSLEIYQDSKLKTVSGDVDIKSINDIFVEASTKSGDIDIRQNNRLSATVLTINTISGDVDVD
ncbi:MAG: DUF4097 family beta strand repeat-containing protein [Bacilli bacterium]|nr:DUF4097 family beta strand repeat-containing protein [Bacilli bacterium]